MSERKPYYNRDNPHPLARHKEIPNVHVGRVCFYTGIRLRRRTLLNEETGKRVEPWNLRSKEHFINKASFLFPRLTQKDQAFNFGPCAYALNKLLRNAPLVVKMRFKEYFHQETGGAMAPEDEDEFMEASRLAFTKALADFGLREREIWVRYGNGKKRVRESILVFDFKELSHFAAMDLNFVNRTKFNGMDLTHLEALLVSEFA